MTGKTDAHFKGWRESLDLPSTPEMRRRQLFIIESPPSLASDRQFVRRLLRSLSGLTRLYSLARFQIIPEPFLLCIDQHLPDSGRVLDLGCGFGLFTLWFAQRRPECQFVGIDSSARRIRAARRLAETLQVRNVTFECEDVALCQTGSINAAYCIDLLHHIPPEASDRLLRRLFERLEPNGKVVIKDVTTRPRGMLYFTWVLDFLVSPKDTFYYREAALWSALLSEIGFTSLYWHPLRNFLPYPHFLLVGSKPPLPL